MTKTEIADKDLELLFSSEALGVLRAHLGVLRAHRKRYHTLPKLIQRIVHEWVTNHTNQPPTGQAGLYLPPKSKAGTPDLALTISIHDMAMLRSHVHGQNDTVVRLIEQIIHEWAIHPARFQGNLLLPSQNSVLFPGETLRSYIQRAALAVVHAVYKRQRGWGKTAKRLGYERTAFAKLCTRLKRGQETSWISSTPRASDSHGHLPLARVIHDHVNNALRLCNGNQEQACHVLGIPLSRLNLILLVARTETEYDLLVQTDNQCLSDPE